MEENLKNEIVIFENQNVKLEVNVKDETVWLTQAQMAKLFRKSRSTITEHINNVFKEKELEKKSNVGFSDIANSDKPVKVYSLDVIISVGYRVKSKEGTIFRQWANKVLKDYLIKGYAINEKRLRYLEKTVKLIDIANRIDDNFDNDGAKEILKVIGEYSKALDLLDDYDHKTIKKVKGKLDSRVIEYKDCLNIIETLKFNQESDLFAIEREHGLQSVIRNIYQSFDNEDLYQSIEEKAANFLYLIIKNHIFVDGNKRVGATLFIYFLNYYDILYKENEKIIGNKTLTALVLLIAQSNPKEKDIIIDLIMNLIV